MKTYGKITCKHDEIDTNKVTQNVAQTNYVPQVSHIWHSCGAKTSDPLVENNML